MDRRTDLLQVLGSDSCWFPSVLPYADGSSRKWLPLVSQPLCRLGVPGPLASVTALRRGLSE